MVLNVEIPEECSAEEFFRLADKIHRTLNKQEPVQHTAPHPDNRLEKLEKQIEYLLHQLSR